MSLILEALRRSEAERRRGAPPSLLGDTAPPSRAAASPWPIALGGLLLGLLLAAAAWWWSIGGGARTADAPPTAGSPAIAPVTEARVEPVPSAAYAPAAPPIAPMPAVPVAPPRPSAPAVPTEPTPAAPGPLAATPADIASGPRDGDLPWSAVAGQALPTLRVSMHVYADDPARRFAIIDGQRRREGETVLPGLALLEIRRDGLRFQWQDRVLWVPR